ncbi:M50 family metallopeptidase [Caldalkalibacillus salinus]|uniref:M50 family metallopeptidase n=1 Tax=Caldalkalibacillus salinus TaxID=2803787 RepID=UPI001922B034|nr:M50 family metallopeptidase [Caldalkalibacillus salinus]
MTNRLAVHPLFFLIVFIALVYDFIYEVLLLFTVVLIHELGHALTAHFLGWRVRKIQLLPIGGVAEIDEYGTAPMKEEWMVTLAGPLTNVIMLGAGYGLLQVGVWEEPFAYAFLNVNAVILLFNLLPIWPLDGGRCLQLLLCLLLPYYRAVKWTLWISLFGVSLYILVVLFVMPQALYLWMISVFLVFSIYIEFKQSSFQFLRFLMHRHYGKKDDFPLDTTSVHVSPYDTLHTALEKMFRHKSHYFFVMQANQFVYLFSEEEMLSYYFEKQRSHCTVQRLLR